tara:strand:+ start:621 stop:2852 length:2232 start_codon:yes stop_codon:yes gene_type:complete
MINSTKIIVISLVFLLTFTPTGLLMASQDGNVELSSSSNLGSVLSKPFHDYLSSSVWLITQGLDPRFKTGPISSIYPPRQAKSGTSSAQASSAGQGPLVPYRNPSQKFSRNMLITRDFSPLPFQTEPSIAVNPKDPEHLVLGVVDYNFPGITSYTSIDSGTTWEGPYHIKYPPDDQAGAGDPVISFDRDGNVYAAGISVAVEDFTVGTASGESVISSIPISRSLDGGVSWEEPISSRREHVSIKPIDVDEQGESKYELSIPFLDKPWVSTGPSKYNPENDNIYVTYTKFVTKYRVEFLFGVEPFLGIPITETSIEMVKSLDQGQTWSEPVTVSPVVQSTLGQEAEKRVLQGSQPSVAPDGTLYIAWVDSTDDNSFEKRAEIYVAKSETEGLTFTTERAADFNEIPFSPRNSFFRYWASGFPQISIDKDERIYVMYTARSPERDDDGNIYLAKSGDYGNSWTNTKINDDNTNRLQFFPSITSDPNGNLHAMWGDMRDDPSESKYHIYYSTSEDGGKTWTENSRVTDFPTNPNHAFPGGAFIGDYFTIAATEDEVYMAWPDGRLGEFGPQNQKIGFARKELMPMPSIFLSPPSGPGGMDITIQGSNFQPDQDVYLEISGAVISTVRSDDIGNFSARIFVPISGEGAHDFRAIDASGNVANASFYMDFGFDNIQDQVEQITDTIAKFEEGITKDIRQDVSELISDNNLSGNNFSVVMWAIGSLLIAIGILGPIGTWIMLRKIREQR